MTDPRHIELVHNFYKALQTGDIDLFWGIQDEDVAYNMSGHSPISGRLRGKANLAKDIVPHVFAALDMEKFRFATKWKIVCADEHRVVVFMEADGPGKNGLRYDQRYVHMFAFRNGKIGELWEFFDTALAAAVMFTPEANVPRSPLMTEFDF